MESRMPKNYLTRKSYIEKLIYHATMSDSLKSPFAGFKVANDYIEDLDNIDVISGIKTFKSFIRSFFKNNTRSSTIIHRVGGTWLLDEFDIDSFLLTGGECREWLWLREFLKKEDYRLCLDSLSRSVLISHDLESKFLYHTVFQLPELGLRKMRTSQPKSLPSSGENDYITNEVTQDVVLNNFGLSSDVDEYSYILDSASTDGVAKATSANQSNKSQSFRSSWVTNPDMYLHTAEWQLKDLSFLVGSDMPIFGTPKHPCISLKLSPLHESINVLTGVDVWLENIINEVPEVAMCYHHEGIVMQEYEIYKTCEIPSIVGFETEQINRIIRNLIMFLKRNATQEGHTYWLVKEPGLGVVKLYDLTTLGYKEFLNKCAQDPHSREAYMKDNNPFILPVATLCYKLAERRVKEYTDYREAQILQSASESYTASATTQPPPPPYSSEGGFDEVNTVIDALRLLKNCLNLISIHENLSYPSDMSKLSFTSSFSQHTSPGVNDLKFRAVVLLCRLYSITPTSVITTCFKNLQGLICSSRETVSVDIEQFGRCIDSSDLNAFTLSDETGGNISSSSPSSSSLVPVNSNRGYLGSMIIDAFRKSNTSQLSQLAISILGACGQNLPYKHSCLTNTDDQDKMLTPYSSSSSHHRLNNSVHDKNSDANINDTPDNNNNDNRTNESQTFSLPLTILKSYIGKSEELWFTVYQQMHNADTVLNISVIESLKMIFRYTLPALILLEHLVPDAYTHIHSLTNELLSTEKFVCPYCSSCDIIKNPLDHRCLNDTLFMISCLFSAAFISYSEALKRINPVHLSHHHHQMINTNCKEEITTVDTFIMQSACEQSKLQMENYLHAALMGPVKLSPRVSSSPPSSSVNEEINAGSCSLMTRYENWFKILNLAACCLQRVFLQSSLHHHPHRLPNKPNNQLKRYNKTLTCDSKLYMTKLKITNDWWPVLMNMFVCSLRGMWLECISTNEDEDTNLKFNQILDQYLSIISSNPLECMNTTTANDNLSSMNITSYLLNDTNEFQLFKLLALYSQSSPSSSPSSSSLLWANKLSSLYKWRKSQECSLPMETLFFNQQVENKLVTNNKKMNVNDQFSLTSVCLARSIEALLHYQISQTHSSNQQHQHQQHQSSVQFCVDLLRTGNEYLAITLEEFKSFKGDKAEYLDIINNVLKQILRHLPSDLTPYSTSSSTTTTATTTSSSGLSDNSIVNKDILRLFVNLRLHQLYLTLLRHQHGVTFKRGKSQTPAWSTMITQTRTTLDWHSSYITNIISKENDKINLDVQDIILHVNLLSHLVNLQTVNQSVLSPFGIQTILRDIYRIQPILGILNDSVDCSTPDVYNNLQGPLNSISHNLHQLCDTLIQKLQNRRDNKSEQKSTIIQNTKKKNKQKVKKSQEETSEITSPESLLLSNIKQVDDVYSKSKLSVDIRENEYNIFKGNCQMLKQQIDHLEKYLSGL
uniref:EDRF1 N-terminal domain-containing protein n=1 Tax=Trichobilharzia regenti TaxID=157069 RepID=A0AA85KFH5_TRIRE|nr:unnamed protein product [Trichobilharzia regenti]